MRNKRLERTEECWSLDSGELRWPLKGMEIEKRVEGAQQLGAIHKGCLRPRGVSQKRTHGDTGGEVV